jgi:hydrogenase maturation protease
LPVLVIGLGNPLFGDDGVGWRIAGQVQRYFESLALPVEVDFSAMGGLHLMERLEGYTQVVLIDAILTGTQPMGHVFCALLDDLPDLSAGHLSSAHDTTLQTALKLGQELGLVLPDKVHIVAVEARQIYDLTEELTPAVAAAVSQAAWRVVETVYELLRSGGIAMLSPELLRRYPFFASLEESHLKAIAMLASEVSYISEQRVFEADQPADALYLLLEGGIDLQYVVLDPNKPGERREFFVGEVNVGEAFGISGLIEPYRYTTAAAANAPTRVIKIEAKGLRALCDSESNVAVVIMRNVAKAAMGRLHDTRVNLAAIRAS